MSDAVYYQAAERLPFAKRVMARARQRMFDLFMSEMKPTATTTIIDIGASEVTADESNFIERYYPYPDRITCAGLGDGQEIQRAFPEISYRSIRAGEPLPFPDKSFDIAYSNAVLEHVGGPAQRRLFVLEALRVARALFFGVPNKWFPVEHHTGIPLLHYVPPLFRHCTKGTQHAHWSRIENVDFLTAKILGSEWPGSPPTIVHSGIPLGPFSSNIVVMVRPE